MIAYPLLGAVFVVSFAITSFMCRYARRRGMIDQPHARGSHVIPTPRAGGVAIVASFLGAMVLLLISHSIPLKPWLALAGGGFLVAAVGFADDFNSIRARWRIAAHFTAAVWTLYWLGGFPPVSAAGGWWDLGLLGELIGLLTLVWLLNLYNFMDGIDGIAGAESLSVTLTACLLIITGSGANLAILWIALLAAATLGFLPWNWPPARIFMGDVGSCFIGFTLAAFAIQTANSGALSIWSWMILMGVFITDATFTLLRRLIRGERWYLAHRSHAYQHAAQRWGSHRWVTLWVLAINVVWLAPLAWFVNANPKHGVVIVCAALLPLVVLTLKLGAGVPRAD